MTNATSGFSHLIRKLMRAPVFTLVSVFTLAVGIGANTAIFGVVNGVLLKPLPFRDPAQLIGVWHTAPGLGFDLVPMSPSLYFTYREESTVFEDIGMYTDANATVTGLSEPERVPVMFVTDGVLPMLGVSAAVGRAFTREDDLPGTAETVILSWSYWKTRFGGERSAVGRMLNVDGRAMEIIGVLPESFRMMRSNPSLYLPFRFDRAQAFFGNFSYEGIARIRPGTTIEQVNADMERLVPITVERFNRGGISLGMLREARFAANAHPLKQDVVGDVGSVLWVLLGTVGLVLLIACANVANLFLVRAEATQREIAVRTALGASRGRIARHVLEESLALGLLGGVLGTALAWSGLQLLIRLAPDNLPRLGEIGIDPVVLAFAIALSVFAGLLFGIFPVVRYRATNLAAALRDGGRGASTGRERHRLRGIIASAEVALSLVLLVGAGLMVRSFRAMRAVNPGFANPEQVLTVRVAVPDAEVPGGLEALGVFRQILDRLSAVPGVTSVGASQTLTMDASNNNDPIFVEDHPTPPDQLPSLRRFKWALGDYWQTMGNPIVAGRAISVTDVQNTARVAMISENLAREYWSDPATAIGKRIRQNPTSPWREIIGVVGDELDDGPSKPAVKIVYWPMAADSFFGAPLIVQRSMAFVIRTSRPSPLSLLPEVRQAIWSVNPNLPLANVRTLDQIFDASMARTSFTLVMLGIAAGVALVLGVVGIYGVIAYIVSQRTREIGVRLALGATGGDIRSLVLRQGLVYAGAGSAVGVASAVLFTRLMKSLLFGVTAVDLTTYFAAAIIVVTVSLSACFIPALRASSISPNEALRAENA